jgi:acyl dehydratase
MIADRTAPDTGTTLVPVTRTRMARYASAVQDFNPVHFDDEFARAAGLPTVIVQGPFTVALVLDALRSEAGLPAAGKVSARLKAPVFPGEELTVVRGDAGAELRKADGTVAVVVSFGDS